MQPRGRFVSKMYFNMWKFVAMEKKRFEKKGLSYFGMGLCFTMSFAMVFL